MARKSSKHKQRKHHKDGRRRIDAWAPERVAIMEALDEAGRPLKRGELGDSLDVHGDDSTEIFRRRLTAMVTKPELAPLPKINGTTEATTPYNQTDGKR